MRVVITFATTGNTLMDVSSGRFDTMPVWQLREFFVRYIEGVYFEWLFIVKDLPMSDTGHVRVHTAMNQLTGEIELGRCEGGEDKSNGTDSR